MMYFMVTESHHKAQYKVCHEADVGKTSWALVVIKTIVSHAMRRKKNKPPFVKNAASEIKQNKFEREIRRQIASRRTPVTLKKMKKVFCYALAVVAGFVIGVVLVSLICYAQSRYFPVNANTGCVRLDGHATCHFTNPRPFRFYGTKTSYNQALLNSQREDLDFKDCVPKIFYLFSRHATRHPDKDNIEEMMRHLPLLRGKVFYAFAAGKSKICPEDIRKLESWKQPYSPDDDNKITKTGEKEASDLARRYKAKLPSLLDRPYSSDNFVFEYTSKERTLNTAEYFARGLFGDKGAEYVVQDGKMNDNSLNFHKTCKDYFKKCNQSNDDIPELQKFEKGYFWNNLLISVSQRLGFNVSFDEMKLMYRSCSHAYASELNDAWCSAFSEEDLKVLEYEADLDDYYKDGYGFELNYKQACPVAKYLVNLFRTETKTKAVFQFSHAGAVKKVYAMFNLSRDAQPLKAEDLCSQQNRKWRSSLICPFNSNLVLVLLTCNNQQQKVAAFLNEKPVVLGGCSELLCPVEEFYAAYNETAQNCDIKDKCCLCCA